MRGSCVLSCTPYGIPLGPPITTGSIGKCTSISSLKMKCLIINSNIIISQQIYSSENYRYIFKILIAAKIRVFKFLIQAKLFSLANTTKIFTDPETRSAHIRYN